MPILDLSAGQKQRLLTAMLGENPAMATLPAAYFDFTPTLVDGGAQVKVVGRQGRIHEGLTGKRLLRYPQFDLSLYFKNIPVVVALYRPTSMHEVLPLLAKQYGLVIDPSFVIDDPLTEVDGPITLRFVEGALLFKQPSFVLTLKIRPTPAQPIDLSTYITSGLLSGFGSAVQLNLTEITKGWTTDPSYNEWLAARTVGGPYEANGLAAVINASNVFGTWVCQDTQKPLNLWNTYIAYNGNIDDPAYDGILTRCIKFALSPDYFYIPNVQITTYVVSVYY